MSQQYVNEYYIDITGTTPEMEQWFIDQGARVVDTGKRDWRRGKMSPVMDVYFGHRKIHFLAGGGGARIFFNDDTSGVGLLFLLIYNQYVVRHTLDRNDEKYVYSN